MLISVKMCFIDVCVCCVIIKNDVSMWVGLVSIVRKFVNVMKVFRLMCLFIID